LAFRPLTADFMPNPTYDSLEDFPLQAAYMGQPQDICRPQGSAFSSIRYADFTNWGDDV
jgi:hypothetical protein